MIKWAYGVTTVPERAGELLPRTLASLIKAGFEHPRLFVDNIQDPHDYVKRFNLPVTVRFPKVRSWANWWLGLQELYVREPNADRYAMFQDDFVTYRNLRAYLNKWQFPERGYWNLYTFPSNQSLVSDDEVGWFKSNGKGRGAVALVFDRTGVIDILSHPDLVRKPRDPARGHKSIDGAVSEALVGDGKSLAGMGYTEYVHNPSLVQHTGVHSSMGTAKQPISLSFVGEEHDARSIEPVRGVPSGT